MWFRNEWSSLAEVSLYTSKAFTKGTEGKRRHRGPEKLQQSAFMLWFYRCKEPSVGFFASVTDISRCCTEVRLVLYHKHRTVLATWQLKTGTNMMCCASHTRLSVKLAAIYNSKRVKTPSDLNIWATLVSIGTESFNIQQLTFRLHHVQLYLG